ncbi:MAG: CAP domain-containing protein [Cyclobacteriaceae bacterium]
MKYSKLTVIALVFLYACIDTEEPSPDSSLRSMEGEVLDLVNDHRTSQGLPLLIMDQTCHEQALIHSKDMADGTVSFGHDGFDGRAEIVEQTIGAIGVGENVASGYVSAEDVMEGWLNSSGHRANIQGDFNRLGVGIVLSDDDELFFTQIFAKVE